MDVIAMFRFVCLFVGVTVVTSNSASYSDWARKALRSDGRARRHHKGANNDVEQTTAAYLTRHKVNRKSKRCCQNGGLCIMNSFCHCKTGFYGRHCEHVIEYRACGTMKHGTWMSAACNLCYCFDGRMVCKAQDYPGCDEGGYTEGIDESPEYAGGADQNSAADYDAFYDGYEQDYVGTNGSRLPTTDGTWTVVVIGLGLLITLFKS